MRKYVMLFILVLFIPFVVSAESCDMSKISISSITLNEKTDTVEEVEPASVNGRDINLNLSIHELGDNIEYKFEVKNDSDKDYEIDENSFNLNTESVNYSIRTEDESNIVKANSSKTVYLRIGYEDLIPSDEFESGKYNKTSSIPVNLSSGIEVDIPNTFVKISPYIFFIVLFIVLIIGLLIIRRKSIKYLLLVVPLITVVPITTNALCNIELKVNSNIEIIKKNYMPCIFEGDMVQGAEFVYGDFIYRYKQEYKMNMNTHHWFLEWVNMDEDGWGVIHKDADTNIEGKIAPRMCSSINGKPIVSMSYAFYNMNQITMFDASYIDTSNVVDMDHALYYIGGEVLPKESYDDVTFEIKGLEYWDVSKVRDMQYLFYGVGRYTNEITISDYSKWDTSNVENMGGMFYLVGQGWEAYTFSDLITDTKLHINGFENWDVSNVKSMFYMFSYVGATAEDLTFDFSNWDVSNVENMEGMFEDIGYKSKRVVLKGLDKWNVSKVKNMEYMFSYMGTYADYVEIGDLSNWNVSNVESMNYMFGGVGVEAKEISFFDISNWDTRNVKNMDYMFNGFAMDSESVIDIGTLNVYADSIKGMFEDAKTVKVNLNIYTNPQYYELRYGSIYNVPFKGASTYDGSLITVNYSNNTTNIDDIIATKSDNSNVVKGVLLD